MLSSSIRLSVLSSLAIVASASAAFTSGDLAVVRVNGAVDNNTDFGASVSIDVYSPNGAGGYSLTGTHALPSTGPGAFTMTTNTNVHDGILRQSTDGRYLTLAGYQAAAGTSTFLSTASAVPRVIARIDGNYAADTSTVLKADYDQTAIEAVASTDGSGFWIAGSGTLQDAAGNDGGVSPNGGLRYVAFGGTTATHIAQQKANNTAIADNMRNVLINNGQLYLTTASGSNYGSRGLFTVGTGLPTGGTQTVVPQITNLGASTLLDSDGTGKAFPKTDCVLLDLNPTIDGVDTAYSTGGKKDYQKWIKLADGTWQNVFQKSLGITTDINTLTAAVNGSTVTLFAATVAGVYQMADTTGYSTSLTPTMSTTPLFGATAGTQFRGLVALVPEPASMALLGLAGVALLRRKR